MGKIFDTLDDKHKTHDEILYGVDAMKATNSTNEQQAPLSLVSVSAPVAPKPAPVKKLSPEQQKSQDFLNKLSTFSATPSYSPGTLHVEDDDDVSLLDHSTTNPFDKVSDKG